MIPLSALTTLADTASLAIIGKGIMLGLGFFGPSLGIGLIGAYYFSAVGRNPEVAKFLGQALVFVAFVELFGLLLFASIFIIN